MLSAQENTHVDLGQQQGATIAFIETGFANSLDRNMSRPLRQQLFDNGYAGAKAALVSARLMLDGREVVPHDASIK